MTGKELPRRAAILAIGDELLTGAQLDTNSPWLSQSLASAGFAVQSFNVLGDDERAIVQRIEHLCAEVELLILTGGLGPTLDDLTRHAVATATGADLVLDANVVAHIRRLFEERGRAMSPTNERQALFPRGATVLDNPNGSAPGFRIQLGQGAWIVALPGPPRELQPMFDNELRPWLDAAFPSRTRSHVANFYLSGLPESEFATRVGDWMARDADPLMGVCASGQVLKVRIESASALHVESHAIFVERLNAFRERLAEFIFSESDPAPESNLARLLIEEQLTFTCAESCTGGEIASRMIARPGISAVFLESFVTYSNESKCARLGVDADLLETCGAVSAEVAAAMALGATRASGARIGLSTTGIAGPDGGSAEKPVGLVYLGLCVDGEVSTRELRLPNRGRDLIRDWATTGACEMALRTLQKRKADLDS